LTGKLKLQIHFTNTGNYRGTEGLTPLFAHAGATFHSFRPVVSVPLTLFIKPGNSAYIRQNNF